MKACCCWCIAVILLFSANLSVAGTSPSSSMVTLEVGGDSADTREAYADLDLGFDNGMHLLGMLGKSRQQSADAVLDTTSRLVGISSDYGATVVGGFDYESWGDADTLETRTKRFKLGANTDNWYFQLTYEDRQSRLYTTGPKIFVRPNGRITRLPDIVDVDSTGNGLNISYYGLYPWALNLGYIRYTYDRDVTVLEREQRLEWLFSSPTMGMAKGFESWRRSGDLSYNFNWGTLGISGIQSESAVDKSIASDGAIYGVWDMSDNWSLTLTSGQYGTDNSAGTITYGRAALGHRW